MRTCRDVELRECTPNDAATVADIVRRSYWGQPLTQVPADMPIYHAEYHADAMLDAQSRWRLLEAGGRVVGVIMWRALPSLAHLHLLFVDAGSQGKGYGSMLLKRFQIEAHREDPSLRILTLHCLSDAHRTVRFYKRHGYTQYNDGDEGRVIDLYLWLDAAKRHDTSWPLKKDKLLFYKLMR
ncbi:MAG: GNAT family N-acetyltransferase [Armatimonadetes bacterium]|nr:GNAT family N-acetyltransferase [Armatimonadota bacterium]